MQKRAKQNKVTYIKEFTLKNENNTNPIETNEKISFLDLILVIAKRWKLIFWITFSAGIFILTLSIISLLLPPEKSFLPNIYDSNVVIMFHESEKSSGLSSLVGGESDSLLSLMGGSMGSTSSNSAIIDRMIYAPTLLDTLINEFDLINFYELSSNMRPIQSTRDRLKKDIKIEDSSDESTITITYSSIDPEFSERVILRLVELLQVQYSLLARDKNEQLLKVIEDNILVAETQMNQKLQEFTEFQKASGIIDPTSQIAIKSEITTRIENSIIDSRLKLEEIASFTGYNDPQIVQVQREIKQMEKALSMQIDGIGVKSKYNLSLSELINLAPEFNKIQVELQSLQQLYINLRVQKQAKELELSSDSLIFQVVQLPYFFNESDGYLLNEPPLKSGPSRGKLCILVVFASFFLATLLAFVLEFTGQLKNDSAENEKIQEIKSHLPRILRRKRK